jgi:putative flippase GtrA
MLTYRFTKFLAVGGVAALANFGSRIAFSHWVAYVPAICFAYVLGMATAFVLNRLFVFKITANSLKSQVWWFTIVNLAAALQTLLISVGLADYAFPALGLISHRQTIAHAVGVLTPAITSYLGHKHLSFRSLSSAGR